MPKPLALCLEDLDASQRSERYLRCVALVGRQPGLRLDADGAALWQRDGEPACELWVSADDRLIAYRPAGAPPAVLRRAGRSLQLPEAKPVVVLDQDQLEVGSRRLRLHVHGPAPKVSAPSPLSRARSSAVRAAAVFAVGAAVAGCPKPVEVRDAPPAPPTDPGVGAPPEPVPPTSASASASTTPPEQPPEPVTETLPPGPTTEPIEVREDPPDIMVED